MFKACRIGFLVVEFLALTCASFAADNVVDCHLSELASIDLVPLPDGQFAVPVLLNGEKENLVVGTANGLSLLDWPMIDKLGLNRRQWHDVFLYRLRKFQLDRIGPIVFDFGSAPARAFQNGVVGVLGTDFLHNFDVELDLQRKKLILFSPKHCVGQVVYWTSGPVTRTPIIKSPEIFETVDEKYDPVITAILDGKAFTAVIDTRSTQTTLDKQSAQTAFESSNQPLTLTPVTGKEAVSGYPTYSHSFAKLSFGGVEISNPQVRVVEYSSRPEPFSPYTPVMNIGLDILRRLHVYFAFDEGYVYVTDADAH